MDLHCGATASMFMRARDSGREPLSHEFMPPSSTTRLNGSMTSSISDQSVNGMAIRAYRHNECMFLVLGAHCVNFGEVRSAW